MRIRNCDTRQDEPAPEPQPAADAGAEDAGARARGLLDLGDELIRRALSSDSQSFLAQNRQQGRAVDVHGMLFGMETELAFAAWQRTDGSPAGERGLLGELYRIANARLVSLPEDRGPGLFLANGARFYLDRGDHPEICTPECQSPAEVVRWQLACERILAELVAELERRHPDVQVALFRCNVDYSGNGASWGCHESYQHRRSHNEMAPNLIPHLVTRLVYTGAGGFDNKSERFGFLISPRVPQLVREIIPDTPERGIYDLRDEPLSRGGFHRLHVICGESLCSELSGYLKLGTTALVVRLVDAGLCRGSALDLRTPVAAMQSITADTTLRERVELSDGRRLTALQIQAEYLAMVEAQLGADFMPAWAPELCRRWRCVLEQLASDPQSLATSLDWAIKHALYRDRIARSGARAAKLSRNKGLGAQLCEIDTRFGELSPRALFHALDEAGALTHRIPERGSIEEAMAEPPAGGRAQARGQAIRALHAERDRYACGWDLIRDRVDDRHLDLGDPFATRAEWRVPPRTSSSPSAADHERLIARGRDTYNASNTPRAVVRFEEAIRVAERAADAEGAALARFWCASAHHDAGDIEAGKRVLTPALVSDGISSDTQIRLWTRQTLLELERPAPLAAIERAAEQARAVWRCAGGETGISRILLNDARLLAARGQTAEAIDTAEEALLQSESDPIAFCAYSHLRWLISFLLRAGRCERARMQLDAWRERLGQDADASSPGVNLAIAESSLALRLGRYADALAHASKALADSTLFRRHRTRLSACIACLEAVAASRTHEATAPLLGELRGWRDIQIGELRVAMFRAEALVDLARGDGAGEAYRLARQEAEVLDARLACGRHVGELEERMREIG